MADTDRVCAVGRSIRVVFRLRFVGDGPGRPEFEMLANALGISDIVEWAGTRTHDQMPAEFAAASVFILASRGPRGEGLPLTVAESMLSGCAVVATPADAASRVRRVGMAPPGVGGQPRSAPDMKPRT